MASIAPYQQVRNLSPGRSVFDLSYSKKFTCDMGQLIPVMCDEVEPGSKWTIGNQIIVRFQPLVAPILHEINVYAHYFFVPYRILWDNEGTDNWETFITGGKDGPQVPEVGPVLPRWTPTNNARESLWDFLGFPPDIIPTGALPLAFPRDAYNLIFNEYYRDENVVGEKPLTNEGILTRAWEKNYFFSMLPWQQKGTAPAFVAGSSQATFTGTAGTATNITIPAGGITPNRTLSNNAAGNDAAEILTNSNTIDLSSFGFDVADLRLAFQIQKWMERNARAGSRYIEFLRSHFGNVPVSDSRLQRPEYIGGTKAPVIISEVLQTSETQTTGGQTPQGNMAGHGITVDSNFAGKYTAPEYGLIMGIMSIMPRADYQQGIDRQWLHETRYDFFFPEFANLSEQAVLRSEIYATGTESENRTLIGYQGRFDHMRTKHNQVVSRMRSNATGTPANFDYWHLAIWYSSAPALNESFLKCVPSKRIFAVQDEPGLLVNFSNIIRCVRPMPIQSNPGYMDH